MKIKMQAAKRFRLKQTKGFVWVDDGAYYDVDNADAAKFHEITGRGMRVKPKSTKKGD